MEYVVFAGDKGFWGNTGTFVSKFQDAKRFTRDGALHFCELRYNKNLGDLPCVPVLVDDLRAIIPDVE